MANNRRPQMPKRRNYVAKNVNKVHRPQTHRDRSQYNRHEDYLKDQLDDMVDEIDDEEEQRLKEEFKSKLAGEEYDPDGNENYEWWLQRAEIAEDWYPYDPDDDGIDFDYDYDDYDY